MTPNEMTADWLHLRIDEAQWRAAFDAQDLAARAVRAALDVERISPEDVEISLLLTDDASIAALNQSFLGNDCATNVLSWPNVDFPAPATPDMLKTRTFFLGDVALAHETMRKEAIEASKPLEAHAAHLIIHGVLHLLGHRHDNDADAARMEAREIWALARLGIGSPYGEPAADEDERQDRMGWTDR